MKLVDKKPQLKKYFFIIYNMPNNTFYEALFNGAIFGSFFGIAYFAVDGLMKLAEDKIELNKKMISRLKEKLSQCEEKLSQRKEAVN